MGKLKSSGIVCCEGGQSSACETIGLRNGRFSKLICMVNFSISEVCIILVSLHFVLYYSIILHHYSLKIFHQYHKLTE